MQFKQHSISFLAFIIFSLISLFFFFDGRGDCGQAAEGDRFIEGRSAEGWFRGVVP